MSYEQSTTHIGQQMLMGYMDVKCERWSEASALLQEAERSLQPEESLLSDLSGWLWLLGEYTQQSKDDRLAERYKDKIMACIDAISAGWFKPAVHWMYGDRQGVYLSQVALHYAALRSAGFMLVSDTALRTSKEMRDQLFATFMNGIAMVSEQGTTEVRADIVLATVPFGFFTPGDLALLKGLEAIDDAKLSGVEAAIFSWYYAECGKLAKAGQLYSQAAQSGKDSPFVEAVQCLLTLYRESDEIGFDHRPLGSECPYFAEENERYPRTVLEQDDVTIKMIVRGPYEMDRAALHYTLDGASYESVEMSFVAAASAEQEGFWQAVIPSAPAYSQVSYYFDAAHESGIYESKNYSYEVYRWESFQPFHVQLQGASTVYSYAPANGVTYARLSVTANPAKGVQYELTFHSSANSLAEKERSDLLMLSSNQQSPLPKLTILQNRERKAVKARLIYEINEDSRWYGLGERFSQLSYEQGELDNYVYNQYKDQGHRTYIPIPLAIGGDGFGIFLQSSLYSIYRFGTKKAAELEIEADISPKQQELVWHRLIGEPAQQIKQYCHITTLPKLPPKWAFGPWMSSNNWDSDKETRYQLDQNKKHQIAATVIVLEQWSDEATFYIFNDAQYEGKGGEERFTYNDFTFPAWGRWPDPKGLVDRIHEDGLRLLLWQAPVMKYMEGLVHQQHDRDEAVMLERGYIVQEADGSPYRIPSFEWFRGSLVPDFTNEAGAGWWLGKRQYLLDELGIDGFKTDGGECIYGTSLQFHDGRSGAEMRNEYPNTYVNAFHQFANQFVPGGAITFSRAGYSGAQATPMHWAGDEKSTFAAFKASIVAGLSSGLSGLPFWGWDLGGFSGEIPSAELFIRSAQMAAFCPVMQYHAESKGQYNMDRTPWNIAERRNAPEALHIYKQYADLRMNLLPYIYEQAQRSAATGEPLMRALCFDFPQDPIANRIETQYMFGQALLVAPVLEEGARELNMYFPAGHWVSLMDHDAAPIAGGKYLEVTAALEEIPVYIRADSVIPAHVSGDLELASYVGNSIEIDHELMLIAYVMSAINYTFSEEGTYHAELSVQTDGAVMHIQANISGPRSPVLWLKQAAASSHLSIDGTNLLEVTRVDQLDEGCFMRRGNDILLRLELGRQTIQCC